MHPRKCHGRALASPNQGADYRSQGTLTSVPHSSPLWRHPSRMSRTPGCGATCNRLSPRGRQRCQSVRRVHFGAPHRPPLGRHPSRSTPPGVVPLATGRLPLAWRAHGPAQERETAVPISSQGALRCTPQAPVRAPAPRPNCTLSSS